MLPEPRSRVRKERSRGPSSRSGELITTAVIGSTAATVGGLTAGGSGALYGGGLAAGAVGLHSLFKRGKHLLLPQGTELIFVLARSVTVELEETIVRQPQCFLKLPEGHAPLYSLAWPDLSSALWLGELALDVGDDLLAVEASVFK